MTPERIAAYRAADRAARVCGWVTADYRDHVAACAKPIAACQICAVEYKLVPADQTTV